MKTKIKYSEFAYVWNWPLFTANYDARSIPKISELKRSTMLEF